jgi:hypothetical protein
MKETKVIVATSNINAYTTLLKRRTYRKVSPWRMTRSTLQKWCAKNIDIDCDRRSIEFVVMRHSEFEQFITPGNDLISILCGGGDVKYYFHIDETSYNAMISESQRIYYSILPKNAQLSISEYSKLLSRATTAKNKYITDTLGSIVKISGV